MSDAAAPRLDPRTADGFARAMAARAPAYVAGWRPAAGGPGAALVQVMARYLQALAERVDRAPSKHQLAFLELLGVELLPAQAARAPAVFRPIPRLGDTRVPDRTRLAADAPGGGDALTFETERAIALAAGALVEVRTVWPGRGVVADHTAAVLRGRPFTLFEDAEPVRHELYLAHDAVLALSGSSTVEVRIELATPAREPVGWAWEHWDGEGWRPFKEFVAGAAAADTDSVDGTGGLTRSGTVRLVTDCAESRRRRVHGWEAHWVRARLERPLTPRDADEPVRFERISLLTKVDRGLHAAPCGSVPERCGVLPAAAYANETRLDLTKAVQPLGGQPRLGSAFYLRCDEAFSRPHAQVELCFRRVRTPEELADEVANTLANATKEAKQKLIDSVTAQADALIDIAQGVIPLLPGGFLSPVIPLQNRIAALQTARDRLAIPAVGVTGFADVTAVAKTLLDLLAQPQYQVPLGNPFADNIVKTLRDEAVAGGVNVHRSLGKIDDLKAFAAAAAVGAPLPSMGRPELAWEYWNGRAWRALPVTGEVATADLLKRSVDLTADGPVRFTVPADVEPASVSGETGLWIRARLVAGGYGLMRTVTWKDEESGSTNVLTFVEYRPPTVDGVKLGYVHRSDPLPAERVLSENDFRWADHTDDARLPRGGFEPFAALEDRTPTLYLGFDRPLPADVVGLWFGIGEDDGATAGPPLRWETWDGSSWIPISVEDGTRGLAVPGIAYLLYPGAPPLTETTAVSARGMEIKVPSAREAGRFGAGDLLHVRSDGPGETVELAGVQGDRLVLRTPLAGTYDSATVGIAALPRFGRPLHWIRVRAGADAELPVRRLSRLQVNAVWAAQLETYENEAAGSGTGEEGQVFFARRFPVLTGETVEVRELSGKRAAVEEPMLRDELRRAGVPDADVRVVVERGTNMTSEVWVRWRPRPNLLFADRGARVYALERSRGRIVFDGGAHGSAPPSAADNIRITRYRSGRGAAGNVAEGAIRKIVAGVPAEGVSNPRAAEGGADSEPVERLTRRGPAILRHRRQALTAADYEAIALEASPAVAAARALPGRHPAGRAARGWVTVIVVPRSRDPMPTPSFELREQVRRALLPRVPAALAGRVAIVGPLYLPVGVEAVVTPRRPSEGGACMDAAAAELARFLHPIDGGPEGSGWPFGRDVYLSDVASRLEALPEVDHLGTLALLRDGCAAGEQVLVPGDRIVVAGPLRLSLSGGED